MTGQSETLQGYVLMLCTANDGLAGRVHSFEEKFASKRGGRPS